VRWWWLSGPFRQRDIIAQLDWLKASGFGGVELAWIDPIWSPFRNKNRPGWLSSEWTELTEFVKRYADEIGLGCDFTFGCAWPFGGGCIDETHCSRSFQGPIDQFVWASWEDGPATEHRVLDHLNSNALRLYADELLQAFRPALSGMECALFCDSLELRTEGLWTEGLWSQFESHFGYDIAEYVERLNNHPDVRYDYRKLIARIFVDEFFRPFTAICHEEGVFSRVQCHGAPVDLLEAYASVDVPESEGLLFEPYFSRIAASAAALSGRRIVSCEAFTCLYGFFHSAEDPARKYWKRDQIADLKLTADALFANGVNQLVWHGMPFNGDDRKNEFYASVHVGPEAECAGELQKFNAYLTRVCTLLHSGRSVGQLAIYLPNEDAWMADRIPELDRTPGANYHWEMRHAETAPALQGFSPVWITAPFLQDASVEDGSVQVGDVRFSGLYVSCKWLDQDALIEILRLATSGLTVVLRRRPRQPGHVLDTAYDQAVDQLAALPTVVDSVAESALIPMIRGDQIPQFWARESGEVLQIFFAHPLTRSVRYPLQFGQSRCSETHHRSLTVNWREWTTNIDLQFQPYQSLVVHFDSRTRNVHHIDISYIPPTPQIDPNATNW